MDKDKTLRETIIKFLKGGEAYSDFFDIISDFPIKSINTFPPNVNYTFWHLLEHIRITQWDILDFCVNKNYKYITWPDDYWPPKTARADKKDWDKTIKSFNRDLDALIKLVKNPKTDLYAKIPWGEGQIILREALLVADHNAYHLGEFGILRQVTNTWPKNHT